jgi:hypothetical protein
VAALGGGFRNTAIRQPRIAAMKGLPSLLEGEHDFKIKEVISAEYRWDDDFVIHRTGERIHVHKARVKLVQRADGEFGPGCWVVDVTDDWKVFALVLCDTSELLRLTTPFSPQAAT